MGRIWKRAGRKLQRLLPIKYMAAFWVTGYDKATNSIIGYFSSLQEPTGGFINKPGPLPKNALVK